jgi:hypothetical protein
MIEFLHSVKSDLLSRRLLPLLALLGVGLTAAIGYSLTGGSNGTTPSTPAKASPTNSQTKLPVAVASANPNEAVSETPAGGRYQSQGPTRDPFTPLPSPPPAKSAGSKSSTAKSAGSSSAGSSSSRSGSGGGSSSGGTSPGAQAAPVPAPAPKKPAKPVFPYTVSVLFGLAPNAQGQSTPPTPYQDLKLLQPLPSKQDARVSFERVTSSGKGAVFKLLAPPILHGSGICLPSTSECQAIDLEVGHAEELEYVEASGQTVVYELKIVSIAKKNGGANAARVSNAKAALANSKPRAAGAIGQASSLRVVWSK